MKSTSRHRVLSDRIPRVLVFVYFCRGLSGNIEERPTRQDYIEISTSESLLGILNANRKIRKRTDTDVAFTREYSRVSIFHRERECTN